MPHKESMSFVSQEFRKDLEGKLTREMMLDIALKRELIIAHRDEPIVAHILSDIATPHPNDGADVRVALLSFDDVNKIVVHLARVYGYAEEKEDPTAVGNKRLSREDKAEGEEEDEEEEDADEDEEAEEGVMLLYNAYRQTKGILKMMHEADRQKRIQV